MTNSTWEHLLSDRLPLSSGRPVALKWSDGLRDGRHEAVAGADIRRREIHLHPSFRLRAAEARRVLAHELFHFVWVRLGNRKRAEWKALLQRELDYRARGELGWSAEWRKGELPKDFASYACEAFCDTASWLYTGGAATGECTLAARWRAKRRAWLEANAPFLY